ncbi:MarR family transcriptional regulator [Micromonospora globispora]|uniref:MarR family transcriptional regulator n=1 Tax=Micromonospora globispora TaxID=1450148 RepID=A0A317K907_9ACTN|nr:MarR family transcriptional regulator [Micromonospora globispora]PWU49731.1 MarR family transcriptional regulator [Micromonospora globispora]PWU60853.1 MarR family transcriptional regulator [Micromonospora globispora]RQW82664.1 MarR family transcriptional regulator [Micromonospora globispora]
MFFEVTAVLPRDQDDRPDLAAMVTRLSRWLIAMEQPILTAQGLSMWGYVVLTALDETPLRTQTALARTIGADKTRIIGVLDDLQQRGLIRREPDPADRRVHLLRLTPAGRRLHTKLRRAIRQEEDRLLNRLSVADRQVFLRVLQALDAQS